MKIWIIPQHRFCNGWLESVGGLLPKTVTQALNCLSQVAWLGGRELPHSQPRRRRWYTFTSRRHDQTPSQPQCWMTASKAQCSIWQKLSHQDLLFIEIKALEIRYVQIKVYFVDIWQGQNSFGTFTSRRHDQTPSWPQCWMTESKAHCSVWQKFSHQDLLFIEILRH